MFHENDVVKLKQSAPAHSPAAWQGAPSVDLAAGERGTVVAVYTTDSVHYEFEVEFVSEDGMTRGLLRLKEGDIEFVALYDVYLFRGCRTLPTLDELIHHAAALADPEGQKRILQRSPGPGFLTLDLTYEVATPLLQLLKSRRANGYVIPEAYRTPEISREQAKSIAKRVIAEFHATRIPDHTLGPVHLVRGEPVAWTFGAASEQWVKEGRIPGMLFASVDRLDGHIWQPEDFEHLQVGHYRQEKEKDIQEK